MRQFSTQLGDMTLGHITLGMFDGLNQIDSLNYWSDAVSVNETIPSVTVSDSLNNWNDDNSLFSSTLGVINLGAFNLGEVNNIGVNLVLGEGDAKIVSLSDTLSLSDGLILGIGLATGSTLNSWQDATTNDFLVFAFGQTINVASNLARLGPGSSPTKDAWKDGIAYETNPFSGLYISIDDLETFLADFVLLNQGLIFSDSLDNWLDSNLTSGTPGAVAFDSMFFNIFDSMSIAMGSAKTLADNSLNLADAAAVQLFGALVNSDTLNLTDSVALNFISLPQPGDTLSMSDLQGLIIGIGLVASDNSLNLADHFENSPASSPYSQDHSDALVMSDGTSTLLSTSLVNYLRRYLNDVVN